MNYEIILGTDNEEKIIIYTKERNKLIDEIEELILSHSVELTGYCDRQIQKLNPSDVYCFTLEDNKLYAITKNDKWLLKLRLYQVEELLGKNFVKINQSCIANIKKIKKFDASFSGSMLVIFDNGHRDYVSRRQLKKVKERIGI